MQRRTDGPDEEASAVSGGPDPTGRSDPTQRPDPTERSDRACPVCGEHALAVDMPPRIDVMGVQAYSDLLGMGDRPQEGAMGIVCEACGTYWRDLAAFERNDPEPRLDDAAGGEGPARD